MLTRNLRILLASVALTNVSAYVQPAKAAEITGSIVLEMTGAVATEYAKLTRLEKQDEMPKGINISTISTFATVAQHLDNGKIRIELAVPVLENGTPVRMVTLTAVVESSAVRNLRTEKGATVFVYRSPYTDGDEPVPTVAETETNQSTLTLTDLKGIKIRTWTLESEIGD